MHPLTPILLRFSRAPAPPGAGHVDEPPDAALALLRRTCPEVLERVRGAEVLDFGCGTGQQVVALSEAGAARVTGVDINPRWLAEARRLAADRGVEARVRFVERLPPGERYDVVISQNAMEHYPDPAGALRAMAESVRPGGILVITFGPPWYAPYGGHMHHFTRIPWVHLLFPERAVLDVRNRYHADQAARYEDVEGGLNRMSLRKLEGLIAGAGLRVVIRRDEAVKGLRRAARFPVLRELLTNHVTVVLEREGGRRVGEGEQAVGAPASVS